MQFATKIPTGFDIAARINAQTKRRAMRLSRKPCAVILYDKDNLAMGAYLERQRKSAQDAGIELRQQEYAESSANLDDQLYRLAKDETFDAVATLYPMPTGYDPLDAALILGPDKDIDGSHPLHAGKLLLGHHADRSAATACACMEWARELAGTLRGCTVTIVGASSLIGRPLSLMLLNEQATVTLCHEATLELERHTRNADLIISATGIPGLIKAQHIRDRAILIDVGITRGKTGIVGDVDLDSVGGRAAVVTHVPDGIGPITTAWLLRNLVQAAETRRGEQNET